MIRRFFHWLREPCHAEREFLRRIGLLQKSVDFLIQLASTQPMPPELVRKLSELQAHRIALVAALAADAPKHSAP